MNRLGGLRCFRRNGNRINVNQNEGDVARICCQGILPGVRRDSRTFLFGQFQSLVRRTVFPTAKSLAQFTSPHDGHVQSQRDGKGSDDRCRIMLRAAKLHPIHTRSVAEDSPTRSDFSLDIDSDLLAWPFCPIGTRVQDFQALSRLSNCGGAGQSNLSRYRVTKQMDFGVIDAVPLAQFSNRPRLRVQRFRTLTVYYIHKTLTAGLTT